MSESHTDPEALRGRLFYRLGEFTYDHRRKVTVLGVLACIALASLMTMGSDWAEAYGEGDLESLRAGQIYRDNFFSEEGDSNVFVFLVHHESLNDSSEEWRSAVRDALRGLETRDDIEVNYSWSVSDEERYTRVNEQDDGFWAINRIYIDGDRKESKNRYVEVHDSIQIDSEFNSWRTGDLAIGYSFDKRIQDDLIQAEMFSGP